MPAGIRRTRQLSAQHLPDVQVRKWFHRSSKGWRQAAGHRTRLDLQTVYVGMGVRTGGRSLDTYMMRGNSRRKA